MRTSPTGRAPLPLGPLVSASRLAADSSVLPLQRPAGPRAGSPRSGCVFHGERARDVRGAWGPGTWREGDAGAGHAACMRPLSPQRPGAASGASASSFVAAHPRPTPLTPAPSLLSGCADTAPPDPRGKPGGRPPPPPAESPHPGAGSGVGGGGGRGGARVWAGAEGAEGLRWGPVEGSRPAEAHAVGGVSMGQGSKGAGPRVQHGCSLGWLRQGEMGQRDQVGSRGQRLGRRHEKEVTSGSCECGAGAAQQRERAMRAAPTAAWTGPLVPAPRTAPDHKLTWTRTRASPTTPTADAEARVQTVSVVLQRVAVLCPQQDVGPLVCPQSSAWTAVWRGFSPPPPPSTSDKVSVTTTPGSSQVRPPPSWQSSEQAWSGPPEAGRGRKDPWTEEATGFGLQRVPDTPGRVESPGASCADSKPPLKWSPGCCGISANRAQCQRANDRTKTFQWASARR